MYINGTLMSTYGITGVLGVDYGVASTTYYKDWLRSGNTYIPRSNQSTYATPKVIVLFEANDIITLEKNISTLSEVMTDDTLITFNDRAFGIKGSITGMDKEDISPKAAKVTFTLEGMKVSNNETTVSITASGATFIGDGNLDTDAIITFTPTATISSMVFTMNKHSSTLTDLVVGNSYVFDTGKGTFKVGSANAMSHFSGWTLPYVKGGATNLIGLSGVTTLNLEIKYRGRWK